jgi:serine/threonine protein kinase
MHGPLPSTPSPALHPGYRLTRLLGRGPAGAVWEAEAADGMHVALKFLLCADSQAAVDELRAIQMVRALSHPNLVRIDRMWCAPGFLVMAMELADGSLLDVLEVYRSELQTPISPADLCRWLAQAAEAIDFLNTPRHPYRGQLVAIQHCGISPANLLLFGETIKLGDFGLTAPLAAGARPRRRVRKPDYAAPELLKGSPSARSDQYALAVSYCLLRGGRLPFPPLPQPPPRNPGRPAPDLSMLGEAERAVVGRALAPVPEDRWPSCREFAARLPQPAAAPGGSRRAERRGSARQRPAQDTCCHVLAALGRQSWRAAVQDLSAGGIQLLVTQPVDPPEPGRQLTLVLLNRPRGCGRVLRARVMHGAPLPGGDYQVGGAFDRKLSEDELQALL